MRQAAVAAEVARVAPELAILIEILGGKEIDRQRLDPVAARRRSRPSRCRGFAGLAADREPERSDDRVGAELVAEGGHIRRRIRQLGRDRRAAPGADEVRRGRRFARRLPTRTRTRSQSLRWPASNGSPPFVAAAARGIMPRDAEHKRNRAEAGRRCPGGSATRREPGAGRRGRVRRALGGRPMGHANLSRDLGRVRRAHRRRVRNGDLPALRRVARARHRGRGRQPFRRSGASNAATRELRARREASDAGPRARSPASLAARRAARRYRRPHDAVSRARRGVGARLGRGVRGQPNPERVRLASQLRLCQGVAVGARSSSARSAPSCGTSSSRGTAFRAAATGWSAARADRHPPRTPRWRGSYTTSLPP